MTLIPPHHALEVPPPKPPKQSAYSWQAIAALGMVMTFTGFLIYRSVPGAAAAAVGLVALGGQFIMFLANPTEGKKSGSIFPPPPGAP